MGYSVGYYVNGPGYSVKMKNVKISLARWFNFKTTTR